MAATNNSSLAAGTVLDSGEAKYRIVSVLGRGGFGITYLALAEIMVGHVPTEAKFAIKEHFPSAFAHREGCDVVAQDGKETEYERSKDDFISEAGKLASLGSENSNIVKVNEVFEANGTAYYIMQYINGKSLQDYVKERGRLSYDEAVKIMGPILDSVQFLHSSRINHLDIKPDNIMLHKGINGLTPVLIDFGQSVHYKKNGEKTSPKGVLGVSEGYSPLEQYAGITEFSPATDIYALAATLLFALTGETPQAAGRIKLDDVRTALAKTVPADYIEAICKAMKKSDDDRTSSVGLLKADLGIASGGSGKETVVIGLGGDPDPWYKKFGKFIFIALVVAALGILSIFAYRSCEKSRAADAAAAAAAADSAAADSAAADSVAHQDSIAPAPIPPKPQPDPQPTPQPDPQPTPQPTPQPDPQPTPQSDPQPTPQPALVVSNGTLSLGYGTWSGGIRNGKMHGSGTITFTSSHRVPERSDMAEPGYTLRGAFEDGHFQYGKLYDADGNFVKNVY